MTYRGFYELHTKLKIPENFIIHHIDFNRQNNTLINLVCVPNKLHIQYHTLIIPERFNFNRSVVSVVDGGNAYNSFVKDMLDKFLPVLEEMNKWADFKYYLLGYIPNIHNLSYKVEE
jgi:hypothetical protein